MASPVKRHRAVRAPGSAGQALPSGIGCLALVFGQAALRLRRMVSAVAIQEHGMPLEGIRAAVMRPRYTLEPSLRASLCFRATAL
jgi:hypothetical protein